MVDFSEILKFDYWDGGGMKQVAIKNRNYLR